MSTLSLMGLGLAAFALGCLSIKTDRFTKARYLNGVTVIKDKKTGQEYIQNKDGQITKL